MTEAANAVVRILQEFPQVSLPPGEKVELTGAEKQAMTLVMQSAQGCRVHV
jgi:hypothetical protein